MILSVSDTMILSVHNIRRATILALLCSSISLWGQGRGHTLSTTASPVDFPLTNTGINAFDPARGLSGNIWPRTSQNQYVFSAGLWIGAKKDINGSERKRVFLTLNPNSGQSWATPGDYADGPSYRPDLADQYKVTIDHSSSTEDLVTSYHDGDLTYYEGGKDKAAAMGFPLGLQFKQTLHSWSQGPLANVILVRTSITNTTTSVLKDLCVGWIVDPDLATKGGFSPNDRAWYVSKRSNLGLAVVTSEPESTSPSIGGLGLAMLERPAGTEVKTCVSYPFGTNITEQDAMYDFMTSGEIVDAPGGAEDVRLLMATTPVDLAAGQTVYVTTAYLYLEATAFSGEAATRAIEAPAITLAEQARTVLSSVVSVNDENISPTSIAGMEVAPQPIRGGWHITIDDDRHEPWTVSIHDAAGILQSTATHSFDTPFVGPSLQPGWYVVTLQRGTTVVRKIVVAAP